MKKKPITTGRAKKPITTGRAKKPITTGRAKEPTTTGRAKEPTTTGRAKEFTIDRSKWLQGRFIKFANDKAYHDYSDTTSLLRNDDCKGMKCCLGFYASACGARSITGVGVPGALKLSERKKLDAKLFEGAYTEWDSELSADLMAVNDNQEKPDNAREAYVIKNFAKLGVKVKFKGKYPYASKR